MFDDRRRRTPRNCIYLLRAGVRRRLSQRAPTTAQGEADNTSLVRRCLMIGVVAHPEAVFTYCERGCGGDYRKERPQRLPLRSRFRCPVPPRERRRIGIRRASGAAQGAKDASNRFRRGLVRTTPSAAAISLPQRHLPRQRGEGQRARRDSAWQRGDQG